MRERAKSERGRFVKFWLFFFFVFFFFFFLADKLEKFAKQEQIACAVFFIRLPVFVLYIYYVFNYAAEIRTTTTRSLAAPSHSLYHLLFLAFPLFFSFATQPHFPCPKLRPKISGAKAERSGDSKYKSFCTGHPFEKA